MAEWENVPLDPETKKKTSGRLRTAPAYGRAVKKKKKKTACKPRTASAYGRAVKNKQKVDYEPHRPTAARLTRRSVRSYNRAFEI